MATDAMLARTLEALRTEMRQSFDAHKSYLQEYIHDLLIEIVRGTNRDIAELRDELRAELNLAVPARREGAAE